MKVRYQADADLNQVIVRATLRLEPSTESWLCHYEPAQPFAVVTAMPAHLSHRIPNDGQATLDGALARFIEDIVEAVQPLRILLFGSHARGEAGAESDLDLLVVMPEGSPLRQIARRLYREIPRNGFSLDVLVATPSLLEKHRDHPGLIYHTILQEGHEVYAA